MTLRRSSRVAAAAILVGLAGSVVVAAPASAHNYLVSSSPAADATLTEQPGALAVTTNDDLLVLGDDGRAAGLRVTGPDGLYYGDGCVTVLGPEASMPLELGAAGAYEVTWQVVSTDGHPVSGQYSFDWQPAAGVALAEGSESVPDCNGTVDVSGESASAESGSADGSGDAAPSGADAVPIGDVLWIGGALAAVALAVGVTMLVLRRRPRE